ncbi:MAG: hypothetical protein PUB97_08620 [Ruminococcus sp.]|nr:hypothetical protein [Ruminococcus sp.]
MFFATYIQNLHKCIEPTTNRRDFTEKILKMAVKNENLVSYSVSSYNGFYDGKTQGSGNNKKIVGDMISNCAKKIVVNLDESEDQTKSLPKFKNYLKNLQFNTSAKNELCDIFRCELPNINVENYIDELSELLIRIIKEVAGKGNKERTINPQIDDSNSDGKEEQKSTPQNSITDNHTEDKSVNITSTSLTNINETFVDSMTNHISLIKDDHSNNIIINISSKNADELAGLKALINELNSRFMDLDEKGISFNMSSWLCSEEEQNKKEQEFEIIKSDFIIENKKLRLYYLSFPELEEKFEEMIFLSQTLTFWYGYKNDGHGHIGIDCDHQIEEYRKCIHEVWKILSK